MTMWSPKKYLGWLHAASRNEEKDVLDSRHLSDLTMPMGKILENEIDRQESTSPSLTDIGMETYTGVQQRDAPSHDGDCYLGFKQDMAVDMMAVPSHLKLAGFTEEDIQKGRVPVKLEAVTNGFVVEASPHFEGSQDLVAYLFKVTGDEDYKSCNQKSLKRKITDMLSTAKKRRKNKNLKRLIPYLEAEFRAPIKSEPRTTPSLTELLRENDALKRRVSQQENALQELQEKYNDAIQKLKRVCH